jgi:hypothetical protein
MALASLAGLALNVLGILYIKLSIPSMPIQFTRSQFHVPVSHVTITFLIRCCCAIYKNTVGIKKETPMDLARPLLVMLLYYYTVVEMEKRTKFELDIEQAYYRVATEYLTRDIRQSFMYRWYKQRKPLTNESFPYSHDGSSIVRYDGISSIGYLREHIKSTSGVSYSWTL